MEKVLRQVGRTVEANVESKYDENVNETDVRKQREMIGEMKGDRWFVVNHASVEQVLGQQLEVEEGFRKLKVEDEDTHTMWCGRWGPSEWLDDFGEAVDGRCTCR
jgi:hypothetical protein